MKLNEMIEEGEFTEEEAKIGYVGAYTYAEVISGYTSFYLGAKSVCPTVTMDVQFTGSWFDISAEKSTAESLIAGGLQTYFPARRFHGCALCLRRSGSSQRLL